MPPTETACAQRRRDERPRAALSEAAEGERRTAAHSDATMLRTLHALERRRASHTRGCIGTNPQIHGSDARAISASPPIQNRVDVACCSHPSALLRFQLARRSDPSRRFLTPTAPLPCSAATTPSSPTPSAAASVQACSAPSPRSCSIQLRSVECNSEELAEPLHSAAAAAAADGASAAAAMYDSSSEQRLLPPSRADAHGSAAGRPARRKRRAGVCSRALIRVLLVGQVLSLLVTGSGVFSQLLAGRSTNIPTTQSAANYFLLSFFLFPQISQWWRARKEAQRTVGLAAWDGARGSDEAAERGIPAPLPSSSIVDSSSDSDPAATAAASALSLSSLPPLLRVSWWKYLLLAFCDVEGNYLLVKAYQYTSITSVQLLDCFTIPVVMILSRILLRTTYNAKHLLGAFICLVGLTMLILSDMLSHRNDGEGAPQDSNKLFGDCLVLAGCVCYGVSNLSQEVLVKSFDRREFLGMLGLCGTFISAVQIAVVERDALAAVPWTDPVVVAYLGGYSACLFSLYVLTPLLLQSSSALFLNLSLLTSDFWSILFAVVLFKASLHPLYFGAFGIIIAGLLLYNLAGVEWKADAGTGEAVGAEGGAGGAGTPLRSRTWKHVIAQVCGEAGMAGDEEEDDEEAVADSAAPHDETVAASSAAHHAERHAHHPSYASSDATTPLSHAVAAPSIHPHAHANTDSSRWHS